MPDHNNQKFTLYHRPACSYCIVTLSAIDQLGLDIELKNIYSDSAYHQELIIGGGKPQVPCLQIKTNDGQTHWLYESWDIIRYLDGYIKKSPNIK